MLNETKLKIEAEYKAVAEQTAKLIAKFVQDGIETRQLSDAAGCKAREDARRELETANERMLSEKTGTPSFERAEERVLKCWLNFDIVDNAYDAFCAAQTLNMRMKALERLA